jgi:hypothetical protein
MLASKFIHTCLWGCVSPQARGCQGASRCWIWRCHARILCISKVFDGSASSGSSTCNLVVLFSSVAGLELPNESSRHALNWLYVAITALSPINCIVWSLFGLEIQGEESFPPKPLLLENHSCSPCVVKDGRCCCSSWITVANSLFSFLFNNLVACNVDVLTRSLTLYCYRGRM